MSKRWFVPAVLVAAALSLVVSLGVSSAQPTGGAAAGTLKVGAAQGIPQLNPVIRTFAWEEVLFPLLWDGLTKWTPSGATAPDLATSWTGSKDSKTWTFKLRSGVKYSNGDPLTATDVVKTFNYYLDPKTVSQEKNRIDMVQTITAVNPTTVVFKLKTANALFPTAIINVKIVKTDDLANFSKNPITTGPYKVAVVRARLDRDARAEPGLLRDQGEADQDRDRQGSRLDRGDRCARCRRPGRPLGPPVVLGQEGGKRREWSRQARDAAGCLAVAVLGGRHHEPAVQQRQEPAGAGVRDRPSDDPQVGLCRARDRVTDQHPARR